jgi:hypothetical protein
MPEKPPDTGKISSCWQLRHLIARAVDLDDSVEAPIMMPGIRTRCETCPAVRSRIESSEAVEWRRSWCSGSLMFFCEG